MSKNDNCAMCVALSNLQCIIIGTRFTANYDENYSWHYLFNSRAIKQSIGGQFCIMEEGFFTK